MKKIDYQKIKEALTRGVENIYPGKEELERVLLSGKKLRIYTGIDPTGKLHIGHGVILQKLRDFQQLGHKIIILIGDFTATIGDPTGKSETRKPLTPKEVKNNARDYKKQILKILSVKNTCFLSNSQWLNKLKLGEFLKLASNFTTARLLERDMFQNRIREGKDIHVHEFLYPILQAYDSVVMGVDMEVGGNDQTFNMLAGRTLMAKLKNKEKFVLTTKLLVDPTGKKMGKTEKNMVNLDEDPNEMYGKIMAWPDSLIYLGFEICTRVPLEEVKKITNPREAKARLAREIIKPYHGEKKAEEAEKEFNQIFKGKELPSEIPIFPTNRKIYPILDLLCDSGLTLSKNEAKRLIEGSGVAIRIKDEEKRIKNWWEEIKIEDEIVIRAGKRRFVKIKKK